MKLCLKQYGFCSTEEWNAALEDVWNWQGHYVNGGTCADLVMTDATQGRFAWRTLSASARIGTEDYISLYPAGHGTAHAGKPGWGEDFETVWFEIITDPERRGGYVIGSKIGSS